MAQTEVKSFKINIPDTEIDLVRKKLELARFPKGLDEAEWAEDNGITPQFMRGIVQFWIKEYDWRKEEAKINEMPQFTTVMELGDFGSFPVHFVHARSKVEHARPLIFLHGWPGSIIEVQKILPDLLAAGYHVVAPSLIGFVFSGYTKKAGFDYGHQAEIFHNLMQRLGYEKYAVQGGDWGAIVARAIAVQFPENAQVLHTNVVSLAASFSLKFESGERTDRYVVKAFPRPPENADELTYSEFEQAGLKRGEWFRTNETAYQQVQITKPRTFGFAMHDSPVGFLAWMADKLISWTDNYPWTFTELITWTSLHYFPGPTTGFNMYRENIKLVLEPPARLGNSVVTIPFGFSAFAKELLLPPRSWLEKDHNLVYWKEHARGGHFAAYELHHEFVDDLIEFLQKFWK
ncbi:hypothetical protein COCVIDRAFT_31335 [Bipolaris victoriae FI3]|uniref:Epoxide hydrolase N-terminal domain-containing protein n=1 Tax=Bipolaris victoriae (strain FI3) TaxID=930091 RepID=W7EBM5_BIPV3|nr:hypothetical protein COCVIDRAFT_31335 [Bipolaris victoriae FI3]